MHKRYISDRIDIQDFAPWLEGKKVVIKAPTGCGKTTFILKVFLKYCKVRKKKVLILSNRRLLDMQYEFALAGEYECYNDMIEDVINTTYQELSEWVKNGGNLERVVSSFDVVVMDEIHYFYADSDFNAFGTFAFLQILAKATFFKSVICLTATYEDVRPLIKMVYEACGEYYVRNQYFSGIEKYLWSDLTYDFSDWVDYNRFNCCYSPDIESLANRLAESEKKSIVFIDDKNLAEKFQNLLLKTGKIYANDIFMMNSKVLEQEAECEVVQMLVGAGKLLPKILLTTSVLDNGTSVHDPEVENVVLATESKLAFIQMLGRVRSETVVKCNLYIFPREENYYLRRKKQYEEKLIWFEQLEKELKSSERVLTIMLKGWNGTDEYAVFLKNAVTLMKKDWIVLENNRQWAYLNYGNVALQLNSFFRVKLGNMLLAYTKFYQSSLISETKVAEDQIQWIGKSPTELVVYESTYKLEQEKKLVAELMKIKNLNSEQFRNAKVNIAKNFQKILFSDLLFKGDSFENKKFQTLCSRYGYTVQTTIGDNRKTLYSVEAEEINKKKMDI